MGCVMRKTMKCCLRAGSGSESEVRCQAASVSPEGRDRVRYEPPPTWCMQVLRLHLTGIAVGRHALVQTDEHVPASGRMQHKMKQHP